MRPKGGRQAVQTPFTCDVMLSLTTPVGCVTGSGLCDWRLGLCTCVAGSLEVHESSLSLTCPVLITVYRHG